MPPSDPAPMTPPTQVDTNNRYLGCGAGGDGSRRLAPSAVGGLVLVSIFGLALGVWLMVSGLKNKS